MSARRRSTAFGLPVECLEVVKDIVRHEMSVEHVLKTDVRLTIGDVTIHLLSGL